MSRKQKALFKRELNRQIDNLIAETQAGDNPLDLWISDTLVDAMTEAAWNVLQESIQSQSWLQKEGYLNG